MNQLCLDFFRQYPFPPEAIEAICSAEAQLQEVVSLSDLQARMFAREDTFWTDLHAAATQVGVHTFIADLFFTVACIPQARERYRAAGIAEDVFWDSVKDIYYKMMETHVVFQIWGVYCGPWLVNFLRQTCICLGRLQFEPSTSRFDCTIGQHQLRKGDPILNVHIPSFGKLLHEDVLDAYQRAAHFFRDRFPDGKTWMQTETWILYPPVRAMIPEGNMQRWAADFQLIHSCIDPKQDDRYRVFHMPNGTPMEQYPQNNPLQRQLKAWLLEGNQMGIGFGCLLFQDGALIKA